MTSTGEAISTPTRRWRPPSTSGATPSVRRPPRPRPPAPPDTLARGWVTCATPTPGSTSTRATARSTSSARRCPAPTPPSVLGGIGAFSGLFELDLARWRRPVLVSSTDSVGTKVKVAIATNRHRGIGIDLVNHCVNDILCCGAQPLFFLDYYATGKLVPEHLAEVVDGVAAACRDAGCALVGGETAEMPGVYALGDYDIAGFIVGAVERDGIVDGSRVRGRRRAPGACPAAACTPTATRWCATSCWSASSTGPRRCRAPTRRSPTCCSSRIAATSHAVNELRRTVDVRAMAHITGGGLIENVPRVLPAGLSAVIDRSSWEVPALFTAIERAGGVMPEEMWRTFNMGVGMVLAVPREQADAVTSAAGLPVWRIGEVVESAAGSASACHERAYPRRRAGLGRGQQPHARCSTPRRRRGFPRHGGAGGRATGAPAARSTSRATRGVAALSLPVEEYGGDAAARDRAMLEALHAARVELVVLRRLRPRAQRRRPRRIPRRHPQHPPLAAARVRRRHERRRGRARRRGQGHRLHRAPARRRGRRRRPDRAPGRVAGAGGRRRRDAAHAHPRAGVAPAARGGGAVGDRPAEVDGSRVRILATPRQREGVG